MLVVDEAVDVVTCGVGVGRCGTVFGDSAEDVVREADVEVVGTAGHDVEVEVVFEVQHRG